MPLFLIFNERYPEGVVLSRLGILRELALARQNKEPPPTIVEVDRQMVPDIEDILGN